MTTESYNKIESFMLSLMEDSAHDCRHIYRVLNTAMDIAATEIGVDMDILITSCLLHDVGRNLQYENPELCHATEGSKIAYDFLISEGWLETRADWVRKCITSHRFRADNPPKSLEAKILFDADKLDVTGAIGIARTLLYQGKMDIPLYTLSQSGGVLIGGEGEPESFLTEYNFKLKNLYSRFFTKRASELAASRQKIATDFYESLLTEIQIKH